MQTPIRITAHDMTLAKTTQEQIEKKAAKLETFSPRLVSCHIVVGAPVRSPSEKAELFNVSIDLTVREKNSQ